MIKTGNRNFWIAQTIGWSLMAGSNLLVQTLAGFLIPTIYRYIIRRLDWRKWNLPRVLQLLVENAVKHGISQSKEGGSISIDFTRAEGFANIRVQNSGKIPTSPGVDEQMGVGLENIRRRLELIYDGKATLSLHEIENNVHALLKVPMA